MKPFETDHLFHGTIAELYEKHLVPMIFETYAEDLVERIVARKPKAVLELAAGTGVLTRKLASALTDSVSIVATDLNPGMLQVAQSIGTSRNVEWRIANAMDLPFADATFDLVVCQFGAMFFPDKAKAFAEARRVLRPGGTFVFNTWDGLETNEFAATTSAALHAHFSENPSWFMARTPHGYFDHAAIRRDLEAAGFAKPIEIVTVARRSHAASAEIAAIAYCQGTPMRNEIEARDPTGLAKATSVAEAALEARFGTGAIEGGILAHVVSVSV